MSWFALVVIFDIEYTERFIQVCILHDDLFSNNVTQDFTALSRVDKTFD